MASHGFVQLPPDGTGKQVPQSVMVEVFYDNGTIDFVDGDICTFSVSTNITGTVIEVDGTTAAGELHIRIEEPVPAVISLQPGENIIVNAITNAKVLSFTSPLYFQQIVQVGRDMINQAEIDEHGSTQVTFPEGSPQFDAFGKLQVSQQRKIADYIMSYDELPNEFSTVIVNNGGTSMVYDHNVRGVVITCGLTSGDKVVRTSDEYHIYQPGLSQLIEFTGSIGDIGKANVIRRAGYYDDDNGVYFEMKEAEFGVGLRSKSTGSVVDTFVPQSEWSVDRLDGSGGLFNPAGVLANPTLNGLFWIDLQWLGAGIVRFGIIKNGVRLVAHEMINITAHSYMSSASLPFRYEQENIGIAASSSEMRVFCATVKTEGEMNPYIRSFSDSNSANITTVSETPVLAMRAAQTYKTFDNRSSIHPSSISVHNSAAEPMLLTMHSDSTATGGAWTAVGGDSAGEINKTVTSSAGGEVRLSRMIAPGETKTIELAPYSKGCTGIRRKADITEWIESAINAKLLIAGAGGALYVDVNWDEIRD